MTAPLRAAEPGADTGQYRPPLAPGVGAGRRGCIFWDLCLLCRRHHVLWHLGKITLADLHLPWLVPDDPDPPP
jgi:hypothetical protein